MHKRYHDIFLTCVVYTLGTTYYSAFIKWQLIAMYKDQDIYGLYDMMKTDESIGDHEDVLLNKRNINWIPQMKTAMMEQRTFFAVGAGHLGGEEGVINLLREAGYEVNPFKQ